MKGALETRARGGRVLRGLESREQGTRGGRNLMLLGIFSAVIAIMTTGVALMIYHNSGDIYLDRSRPGFLPDAEEILEDERDEEKEYTFEKSGKITAGVLEEYLEKLEAEVRIMRSYEEPFSEKALSDEQLGISVE